MANVLSAKEKKRLENQRRWALRNQEAAPVVKSPKTREARINELRDIVLSGTNGKALVQKVMEIAMDDNHQGQMAALKMVIDRIIPQSAFEEAKNTQQTAIQINIRSLSSDVSTSSGNVIDV